MYRLQKLNSDLEEAWICFSRVPLFGLLPRKAKRKKRKENTHTHTPLEPGGSDAQPMPQDCTAVQRQLGNVTSVAGFRLSGEPSRKEGDGRKKKTPEVKKKSGQSQVQSKPGD